MLGQLKQKLETGSASEAEAAVRDLEKIGSRDAVNLLRYATKDDNRHVRQTAIEALRRLGHSSPCSTASPPTPLAAPASQPVILGHVYLLVNSGMPELVKIGYTARNVAERVAELSTATGVPMPFICAYQHPVTDPVAAEAQIHKALENYRCNDNREFFRIEPTEAIRIIQCVCGR